MVIGDNVRLGTSKRHPWRYAPSGGQSDRTNMLERVAEELTANVCVCERMCDGIPATAAMDLKAHYIHSQ